MDDSRRRTAPTDLAAACAILGAAEDAFFKARRPFQESRDAFLTAHQVLEGITGRLG